MNKILFVVGTGLIIWGGYCWMQQRKKSTTTDQPLPADKALPVTTVDQPATDGSMVSAIRHFDTNPQVLFSPPITTIAVPANMLDRVQNYNMINQLV